MGYHRAGFDVLGIDLAEQPDYPFAFARRDVLEALADARMLRAHRIVGVHASPPCQRYSSMGNRDRGHRSNVANENPDLIGPTRDAILATGLPYVIENVVGARAELLSPVQICGRALGFPIHRHRLFETSFSLLVPKCVPGRDPFGIYGALPDGRLLWTRSDGSEYRAVKGLEPARVAMGMPWASSWDGVREAIPPAMTELIGTQLMAQIRSSS